MARNTSPRRGGVKDLNISFGVGGEEDSVRILGEVLDLRLHGVDVERVGKCLGVLVPVIVFGLMSVVDFEGDGWTGNHGWLVLLV